MIQVDQIHRTTAEAQRRDYDAMAYAEGRLRVSTPRPLHQQSRRHGAIRGALFFGAVLVIVSVLAHVVLADPLARLEADRQRAQVEYCGVC